MPLAKRILLVENSRTALAALTQQLTDAGYEVDGVRMGTEALEKAKQGPYFAIIMDLFMPQMNGYEAAKALRDGGDKTPIFAFSASQDPRDKKRALEAGMTAFVQKSDSLRDLLAELLKIP
jgi:CheY-like chemotaxis protein